MTLPENPPPPATVGTQPETSFAVNQLIGTHLRSFVSIKNSINQDHDFLAGYDLKAAPYYFTAEQETLMKSAIADLDTVLDGIDMTFISQLVGLY